MIICRPTPALHLPPKSIGKAVEQKVTLEKGTISCVEGGQVQALVGWLRRPSVKLACADDVA
jgi:hypothetical protein